MRWRATSHACVLTPATTELRDDVESALGRTRLGAAMVAAGEAAKGSVKQLLVPGMLFEELGLKYVGPIDGHSVSAGSDCRSPAPRQVDGPVIVHVVTRKGHGLHSCRGTARRVSRNRPVLDRDRHGQRFRRSDQLHRGVQQVDTRRGARVIIASLRSLRPCRPERGSMRFARAYPERFFDVGSPSSMRSVSLPAWLWAADVRLWRSTRRSCSERTTS